MAALYQYYLDKQDTANLYRVVARLSESKPDDKTAQNNFAQLSLLLNLNAEHAREVAQQLYKADPKKAVYASTYAFSLYADRQYQQAVKVMRELDQADLHSPAIAAYYGIFLAAVQSPNAREFLDLGGHAQLLPEEKALMEKARASLKAN